MYKSSVVAMFDKKESGKKLPIDRLLKMQVAAKRTAEREAKPASADTTPSAQPTEAAVDVEGVSTEPDDHLLRIGSDFAMAFVYSGTGKATRRVACGWGVWRSFATRLWGPLLEKSVRPPRDVPWRMRPLGILPWST